MEIAYATREQVKESLEINQTAYADRLIDQNRLAASRSVEGQMRRRFYPEQRTAKFDWPNYQYAPAWRLWLGINEMVSLLTLTSGGVDITSSAILRRTDDIGEPPYNLLEIDLSSGGAFSSGLTFQQSILSTGVFGYSETATTITAGVLAANLNNSATAAVINAVNNYLPIGVGTLLKIESERLLVVGRLMVDSGVFLTADLTARQNDNVAQTSNGSYFAIGETILIGGERMRVDDIADSNLVVQRAYDGSALADHTGAIFAARNFQLARGVLGSTAAAHTTAVGVYAHEYPSLINELTVAETVSLLEQNASGFARAVMRGNAMKVTGPGQGLEDLRERAYQAHGCSGRMDAI